MSHIAALDAAMCDIRSLAGELAARRGMTGRADSALAKLNAAATEIRANSASTRSIVNGDGRHAVAQVAQAADELKATVEEARGVIRQFGD